MKNILVVCAHSDDQIIGPGATLAKYATAGHKIYNIIFSYGEFSQPHIKKDIMAKIREKEAIKADKIIGVEETKFLGIPEGSFMKKEYEEQIYQALIKEFNAYKPIKIFTHSPDDPIGDHRAVFRQVLRAYDNINLKSNIYSFDIWNPLSITTKDYPRLVVDVKGYFDKKRRALNVFKSQKHALTLLIWGIYIKAIINGIRYKKGLVEVFYKIR